MASIRLTEAQLRALAVMESGGTTLAAAQAAGVTRQTVSSWCNHDSHFIAERNRRKLELLREAQRTGVVLLKSALCRAMDLLAEADLNSVTGLLRVLLSERPGLVGAVGPTTTGDVTNEIAAALHSESLTTASLPDWAIFAAEDAAAASRSGAEREDLNDVAPRP